MVIVRAVVIVRAATRPLSVGPRTSEVARGSALELLVLLLDIGNQIFTKLFALLNHLSIRATLRTISQPKRSNHLTQQSSRGFLRNMQKHVVVALTARGQLQESGSATLDLDATTSLLLNVLDVRTAVPHDLGAKVKARKGIEVDRDSLLGPFALNID